MAGDTGLDLVTGAFSFTGRAIAARLLESGRAVKTLTAHPDRPNPLAGPIEAAPYIFDEPERLARVMEGVTTFYNTYWVRFERGRATFTQAVRNSRTLFQAAREAGVRRLVHISIAKADAAPTLPYYRGRPRRSESSPRSVWRTPLSVPPSCTAMATSSSTTWRGCSGGSRSSRSPARAATASALFM